MKIGYCRVSTPGQKLDAPLDALYGAGYERSFQDVMSSTRTDRQAWPTRSPICGGMRRCFRSVDLVSSVGV